MQGDDIKSSGLGLFQIRSVEKLGHQAFAVCSMQITYKKGMNKLMSSYVS